MGSHNRPMTSSQKICLWGKYAVALVVVAMISLLFVDMSPAPAASSDQVPPTLPLKRHEEFNSSSERSSVTAGHDNYFDEAYPSVFAKVMQPVIDAMGYELIVRNHAIGNNPCYAYDACISTHMGDDLDILTWEQSMNCGHNCRPLDTFTRSAYFMEKKPTVVYVLSGGPRWTGADCAKINLTKLPDTLNRPPLREEEKTYLTNPLRETVHRSGHMYSMAFLKDEKERIFERFASIAPMAQSVFSAESYRCLGPYNLTFSEHSTGGGAPWHPGKRGHLLRGHNLAYFFLSILADAVDSIEKIACSSSPYHISESETTHSQRSRKLRSSDTEMRMTKQQDKIRKRGLNENHVQEDRQRSLALTLSRQTELTITKEIIHSVNLTSLPVSITQIIRSVQWSLLNTRSGGNENSVINDQDQLVILKSAVLQEMIESYLQVNYHPALPSVPSFYGLSETEYPSQCFTDFEPRLQKSLTELVSKEEVSTWTRNLSFFDVQGVEKARIRGLGYLDRKYIYVSTGPQSKLIIDIHVVHQSKIWLCEVQKGFLKYPAHITDLPLGAEVSIDLVGEKAQESMRQKTVIELDILSDQCYRSKNEISPGHYKMTVEQTTEKLVNVAYVVTW
eukprot:gene6082-6698_t